jgi:UDP-3-O-[3-hydroxymyristoyl] glucosamine N-acyltransferase
MQFTAQQIALLINGKIEGNANAVVKDFGKIEEAKEGQLAFLANPKYEEYLYNTKASVIIIADTLVLKQPVTGTIVRVPDPYSAFAILLTQYQQMLAQQLKGIEQPSYVHSSAEIGADTYIAAFSYVGENVKLGKGSKIFPGVFLGKNVVVGEDCTLHAGVKIYNDCRLGNKIIIHAGSVIGSDGFGFAPQENGSFSKVPQIGNVVIEDEVEIGANTTIDRATMGSTIIRKGVKLDNLVQIAHNVEVGSNTVIAAQSGVSGSTKLGKNIMIGGQAGIAGHIQIVDGTKINGQSGVTKSIKRTKAVVTGTPAFDYTAALRSQAVLRTLPELEKRVIELEAIVQQLIKAQNNL